MWFREQWQSRRWPFWATKQRKNWSDPQDNVESKSGESSKKFASSNADTNHVLDHDKKRKQGEKNWVSQVM